jgi:hypothetical protein
MTKDDRRPITVISAPDGALERAHPILGRPAYEGGCLIAAAQCADRFVLHGVPIELSVGVPGLRGEIEGMLGRFREGFTSEISDLKSPVAAGGVVRPYEPAEVLRHVSPAAVRLATTTGRSAVTEIFRDGERFWLVDDRWGIAEMNLFKGTWRSWVLPQRRTLGLEPRECAEMAVLWPMAQVLRGRGLWLLPAAVVVAREGCGGILLLAPFGTEQELAALEDGGYRIVGRRWVCLREAGTAGRVMVMPYEEHGEPVACDAVVVIAPGRRGATDVSELRGTAAVEALRRAWPMAELHRSRGQFRARLGGGCRCYEVQLSRRAEDVVAMLGGMSRAIEAARPKPQVVVARVVPTTGARRFIPPRVAWACTHAGIH